MIVFPGTRVATHVARKGQGNGEYTDLLGRIILYQRSHVLKMSDDHFISYDN